MFCFHDKIRIYFMSFIVPMRGMGAAEGPQEVQGRALAGV
jgi:hypothetical protein